jgi:hypothetical protein
MQRSRRSGRFRVNVSCAGPQVRVILQAKTIMLSTRDLSLLPDINSLRQRLQQMAAIESVFAVNCGESQFEFHPKWDRSEQMGAFKNGSGDEMFAHFTESGCIIIGFAHESEMSPYRTSPPKLWPGLLSGIPLEFKASLAEPAFDIASTTFVVWRLATDNAWHTGTIEYCNDEFGDGSQELLPHLIHNALSFSDWLADNYEVDIDNAIVASVFANNPLTNQQLSTLNSDAETKHLRKAVKETGYPLAE